MFAWMTPRGLWLTYNETTTHTGTHKRIGTTPNIDQAFVGYKLPKHNEMEAGVILADCVCLGATVVQTRTVTLKPLQAPSIGLQE